MIGVATCARLDLMGHFGPHFAELAPELDLRPPERIDRPEEVEFMITFEPDDAAFAPYPNLRAVFSVGAGTDAIERCPSLPHGLPVHRVQLPDQAAQMAGFAAFHVLWHHRRMADYVHDQQAQLWQRRLGGFSPRARRIGILGYGHMGRGIARGLLALDYPVSAYSRSLPATPDAGVTHFGAGALDDFLAQCDILINVLPLTAETTGLIDADFLSKLPTGAALIHLGRGSQVDEAALIAALDRGHLSGASLDVFETEPLPPGHPLWSHPKVLITPHVASVPEPADVVRSIRQQVQSLRAA